jgi:phage-related tail protein
MEKEFTTRAATTENSLQLLKNSLSELSIVLGESLMPTVNSLFQSIGNVLKTVASWISENPELTRTITHLVGGLISAKLATFALGYASTFLLGGINKLVMIFKGLRLGLSLVGVTFKSFLGWPIAVAGVAWTIYENWNSVKQFLQGIWTTIEPYWLKFKSIMDSIGITDFIISSWTRVQTFLSSIWDSVSVQFDSIQKKWNSLVSGFKNVFNFSGIKLPKIGNLFESDSSKLSEKVSEIRKTSSQAISKNQNNNFSITINGAKNDDAESLSQKVMSKVSAFSKTFLYDEATEVS